MLIIQWRMNNNVVKMMPWTSAYLYNAWPQMWPKLYKHSTKEVYCVSTEFTALKWPHLVCHCYSPLRKQYSWIAAFPQSPANILSFSFFSFICLCLFKLLFSPSIFLFICPSPLFVCMDLMTSSYANWVKMFKSKCLMNKK